MLADQILHIQRREQPCRHNSQRLGFVGKPEPIPVQPTEGDHHLLIRDDLRCETKQLHGLIERLVSQNTPEVAIACPLQPCTNAERNLARLNRLAAAPAGSLRKC
jgi:hypothetical protein